MTRAELDRDELSSILSLYHLEGLEAFGDLPSGPGSRTYWVRASGRRYLLRLSTRRRFADLLFEKDLLVHLRQAGLPVPRVVENLASGAFTPWSARGRYVWLFEDLGGRRLGIFELRAHHTRAIGQFLGRMHLAALSFPAGRTGDLELAHFEKQWDRLCRALANGRLAQRHREAVEELGRELKEQKRRHPRGTRGIIHSDLFIGNASFSRDRLNGVLDFERACSERLNWDLAVAINAWCWEPSARQSGGPAGGFGRARVRSFLRGYESVRPLPAVERTELAHDLRLAALRLALKRLVEFELSASSSTGYRDYRHFMARLAALEGRRAEALLAS